MNRKGILALAAVAAWAAAPVAQEPAVPDGVRFRTGIELINVSVTVTDSSGRFVPNLRQEDFTVYEDDMPQDISHFSNARVPVSLGILLDSSGSMAGDKFQRAQAALERFVYDLLDPHDEVFLYHFGHVPVLAEGWTSDRSRLTRALRRIVPRGSTSMYDTVAEAIPLAEKGQHRKKALIVISDGNDTSSRTTLRELQEQIQRTEALIYAVGIDGQGTVTTGISRPRPPVRGPFPFPIPGGRRPWPGTPRPGVPPTRLPPTPPDTWTQSDDRVNADALRVMTDTSGGRTEIIRSARDLNPVTEGIADELSRQYQLAYPSPAERDGRWRTIRVEVKDKRYRVRARQGYFAH